MLILSVVAITAALAWPVPATGVPPRQVATQIQEVISTKGTTDAPERAETEPPIRTTEAPTPEPTPEEPKKTYIGQFTVTGYCSCEICCGEWANNRPDGIVYTASGAKAKDGVTVGAAWDVLPTGTRIEIDGLGERIVQDKPADWIIERYDGRILDVYFGSHEAAQKYGKHTVDVWIIEDGKEE